MSVVPLPAALAAYSLRPPPVAGRSLNLKQGAQGLAKRRGCRCVGSIEYPAAVLLVAAPLDEAGASENGEMVGDEALGEAGRVLDLADAELRLRQEGEDAQTVLVAEQSQIGGEVKLLHGRARSNWALRYMSHH
jgi:hypothetical protein